METNFNFKSQICTSRSQSERLLALGLKKETADCNLTNYSLKGKGYQDDWQVGTVPYCKVLEEWNKFAKDSCWELIPAWSLHRLIEMMPESIHLDDFADTHYYRTLLPTKIIYMQYGHTWIWQSDKQNDFDKCVDTIEWLIKEGYFNKEYLEE